MRHSCAILAACAFSLAAAPSGAEPASGGEIVAPVSASLSRNALRVSVRTQALRAGVPAEIADAVATVESGYEPSAIGGVGEIGLMQVLPSTARLLGFQGTNAELAVPDTDIRMASHISREHGDYAIPTCAPR